MRSLAAAVLVVAACSDRVVTARPDAFVGVGIDLADDSGGARVRQAFPGGPAAGAGLVGGERLVAIDGAPLDGLGLATIVNKLRGPEGSLVQVDYLDASGTRVSTRLVRKKLARAGDAYVPK